MSNYWMETGACLVLFEMVAILIGIVTLAVVNGMWPLALAYPPLALLVGASVHLWRTRPSLNG